MVSIKRVQKRFEKQKRPIKIFILVIFIFLLLSLLLTFSGISPFTVVNIEGKSEYVIGETQTFRILLKTVDPDQFTTPEHYREQYGRWRIEDESGNLLSSGRLTKIENGLYDRIITIQIPEVPSTLISEIIEYQYSLAGDSFVMDEGTIREKNELELKLQSCDYDTDCESSSICVGKSLSCENYVCSTAGQCLTCEEDSDCATSERCVNNECFRIIEPTFTEQVKETIAEPITQPGKSEEGIPTPKTAEKYLIYTTLILWVLIGFFFYQLKKKRKI